MDNNELRKKTLSGLIWRFSESAGNQVVSFIVSLVLARLLMPEEYGVIAIVTVFTSLCNTLVNSGLGTALVQKKNADELDFSTVFYTSMTISVVLYVVMFFAAPWIAVFYEKPILTPVIRVMSLRIVIAGMNTVQRAYISKKMQFRKLFWATFGGTILSGVAGVILAFTGFGVWALVSQVLLCAFAEAFVLFAMIPWKPRLEFSFKRLRSLLSFGWKLLVTGLVDTLYNELRSLIIGKKYSAADLAYYNKGKQYPELISENVIKAIDSVLFPVIAMKQDDKVFVKQMTRRFIKSSTYIMMPMMVGLACVAKPMVQLILTDKWLFCVPYIQIYCVVGFLQPIQSANMQAIKAMGRSDILLKLEIIKKVFGLAILLAAVPFGALILAGSNILYSIVMLLINTRPNRKLMNYTLREQIVDILPNLLISAAMGGIVYMISFLHLPNFVLLAVQILVGIGIYVAESALLKNESFIYIMQVLLRKAKK